MVPRLLGLLLILGCNPTAAVAQSESGLPEATRAPAITHRAAEDKGLNLMLDYQALVEAEEEKRGAAPAGSFGAAQDQPRSLDLSQPVGEGWELEPVVADYRQDGEPIRPDRNEPPVLRGDQSRELMGIELLRKF